MLTINIIHIETTRDNKMKIQTITLKNNIGRELQLLEWKSKLTEECYQDLVEFVKTENSKIDVTKQPAIRGNSLTVFVCNWKSKLNK